MAGGFEKSACEEEREERWDVMTVVNGWLFHFELIRYDASYLKVFLYYQTLLNTGASASTSSRGNLHYI